MCPHKPYAYDIVILSPNAALDSYYLLADLKTGAVNRAQRVFHTAGGKGHNMARAVRRLGGRPLSIGIAGGASGRFVDLALQDEGIHHDLVWCETETRRCNTLYTPQDEDTTVILDPGAAVGEASVADFTRLALQRAGEAPYAALVGSLPAGFPDEYYARLILALKEANVKVCLDTGGAALKHAAQAGPYLIKVNRAEYCAALCTSPGDFTPVAIGEAFTDLHAAGVQALIVTDGARGAFVFQAGEPPVQVRTPVDAWQSTAGAGDTFMAGLLLALAGGACMHDAARFASAAAAANLQQVGCGFFDPDQVELFLARTELEAWEMA